ncbi:hypothetical protein BH09BAC3_BH09BAC3_10920 [soil metagenome]
MLPNTTFTFTEEPSERKNTIKVIINVDDDSAIDQDVLTYIQTQSAYKERVLIKLHESERGVWIAYFRS